MKCLNNKRCLLLIIVLVGCNGCAFGAPSLDTSEPYDDDDDDRVRSTFVTNSTRFTDNYDPTAPVLTTVLNMSDKGTDEILASFNLSVADIQRKQREQTPSNPQTTIYGDQTTDGHSVNKS